MTSRYRARSVWLLIRDAAASLLLRPGHTIGMVSGVMLGVASALAAVVIADTQQAHVNLQFDLQRSPYTIVKAQTPTADGFPATAVAGIGHLDPVSGVGEFSIWDDAVSVARSTGAHRQAVPVVVADPGGLEATDTSLVTGADYRLLATTGRLPIAWIGKRLATALGVTPATNDETPDSQIIVAGTPFSVAGILTNDGGFGYVNRAVVLSRPAALATIGGLGDNVRLVARVRPGSAAAVARYTLRAADPGNTLTLTDVTPPDGRKLVGQVGTDLRTIGAALGLFIGLVGMIAIANTLMMSVHQRRRELGLRSAIGWSRRRIGFLILAESGAAGLVAGVIGSGVGLAAAAIWCWAHRWTLVMPPALPYLITSGGVLASLLGGTIPAMRAASSSPMEAMRS